MLSHALGYIAEPLNWRLCQLRPNSKAPMLAEWNSVSRVIGDAALAESIWTHSKFGIGLVHEASMTGAFDVDDLECTVLAFAEFGIDVMDLMLGFPRIKGRDGRDKIIFRVPNSIATVKLVWPAKEEGGKPITAFEFRGKGGQDVLPPSIHPDTLQPYTWQVAPWDLVDGVPMLPETLLMLWVNWSDFKPQFEAACPWAKVIERPSAVVRKISGENNNIIGQFNNCHSVKTILAEHGYKKQGKRWLSPTSSSNIPGVIIFDDGTKERCYSHHASDPLNTGKAHDAFDLIVLLDCYGDFNAALLSAANAMGISIKTIAEPMFFDPALTYTKPLISEQLTLDRLPGILGDIEQYYNDTAKIPQPMFAKQTALGIVSVLLGRRFKTVFDDFTSLYFLNIAPTACGKEHIKRVTEDVLKACGMDNLLAGDGYTSAGAVLSTLNAKPVHITVIDELGLYLEASSNKSNFIGKTANTALMECIARLGGEVRSKNYSTLGGAKSMEGSISVTHPAITIQSMTTPSTFYENLTHAMIKDGFFGRFIVCKSTMPRVAPKKVRHVPVPYSIINWAKAINARVAEKDPINTFHSNPGVIGEVICLDVSLEAELLLSGFSEKMVELMNKLEAEDLSGCVGRYGEFSGRMALMVELAKDAFAIIVNEASALTANAYMDLLSSATVIDVRENLSGSDYQQMKMEILTAIRADEKGITERDMHRKAPFTKLRDKELAEVIQSLMKAEHIGLVNTREGKPGKARMAFIALSVTN
jgi:hypothetical protein